MCPQKEPPQAGREHTGSCPSRGCALSQRKDRWWLGEPVAEAGAPTSGTTWSLALREAATQGMSPRDTPRAGAHSHPWLGHWALLPGWVPLCGCTDCTPAEGLAQTGAGPPLHPNTMTMSITSGSVPAAARHQWAWVQCVHRQLRTCSLPVKKAMLWFGFPWPVHFWTTLAPMTGQARSGPGPAGT